MRSTVPTDEALTDPRAATLALIEPFSDEQLETQFTPQPVTTGGGGLADQCEVELRTAGDAFIRRGAAAFPAG